MIIKNGLVYIPDFVFKKLNIRTENGRICEIAEGDISPKSGEEVIDADGSYVIPGLTDIHFHGAAGADLCDATFDAIRKMATYEYSVGVTQICPATMTLPKERISDICRCACDFRSGQLTRDKSTEKEAELVGVNLEGPFISPEKVGAQNPEYVQKADIAFLKDLISSTEHLPKLITIAPEIAENLECIKALSDEIIFSIGHTMAGYEDAADGFSAGAKHVTHLYNAMPGLNHRAPGPIAAAAERDDVNAELITDGIHVAGGAVKAAFKLFGDDRIVLISDSTRAAGLPDGEYELGGQKVYKFDGAAWLSPKETNNNTLAGGCTNLFDCMLKAIEMGIPATSAIRAATYNPAKAIGILKDYGSIEVGKKDRLLLLNYNYDFIKVITSE